MKRFYITNSPCYQMVKKANNSLGKIDRYKAGPDSELWGFVRSWIRKFETADKEHYAEKMIYLWVTINAWASMVVPDISQNHVDKYLIHELAADEDLHIRFDELKKYDKLFDINVTELLCLAPVFQVIWMRNNMIPQWKKYKENREDFIKRVMNSQQYRKSTKKPLAPICSEFHIKQDDKIPIDWPHTLHIIYQIRCNLFHGGKNYSSQRDRIFIELSYKILKQMFFPEFNNIREVTDWHRLLIRSGFEVEKISNEPNCYSLASENGKNIEFLQRILKKLGIEKSIEGSYLSLESKEISQSDWIAAVKESNDVWGLTMNDAENLNIGYLDVYIAGIVRWANKAGLFTTYSCEGHAGQPQITFKEKDGVIFNRILKKFTNSKWVYKGNYLYYVKKIDLPNSRCAENEDLQQHLLDLAELLHSNHITIRKIVESAKQITI